MRALSRDELTRAHLFKRPDDRARWVNARLFLRNVLSLETGIPADGIEFTILPGGKPVLTDHDITFNLSHTDSIATVVTGRGLHIGVDVETVRTRPSQLAAIERWALCNDERDEIRALSPDCRPHALFTAWRRKEAVLKAAGTGLSHPMKDVYVGPLDRPLMDPVVVPAGPYAGEPCRIYDIPLTDTCAIALAASGSDHLIEICPPWYCN